ncbi:MAG: hypothetical protein WC658_02885, partial [Candidatus Omnitrophota bacterium]
KLLIIGAIISLGVFFITAGLRKAFTHSDYFKVLEVITSAGVPKNFTYLKGENIFSLDLRKESRYILQQNSLYRDVTLVKLLPNRIFIYFIPRESIALVKLYRTFSIDRDGFLFEAHPGQLADAGIPVITGLETKIFGPKSGSSYKTIKEVILALNAIKAFKGSRVLRYYKIRKIDVANISDASIFIELPHSENAWLQIKMNETGLKDKAGLLANLLLTLKNDLPKVKYIDLRFKEPLIKMKDKNAL